MFYGWYCVLRLNVVLLNFYFKYIYAHTYTSVSVLGHNIKCVSYFRFCFKEENLKVTVLKGGLTNFSKDGRSGCMKQTSEELAKMTDALTLF